MNYKSRKCFDAIHEDDWKRCYIVSFRRSGKSYAMAAEMLKRAYNGAHDGQYLFISPLAEQSESNIYGMFKGFDNEGYIIKYDKESRTLLLANGATITFGGARTAEKFRGRYLDGCVFDEYSQIPPHIFAEIIQYCLADRNGWCAFIGTARSDDGYRLYKGYLNYKDNKDWLCKKISWHDNEEAFTEERIKEIKNQHFDYCLSNGYTKAQAEQAWMCEMECDFSFLDEGRPDMQAMYYNEIQQLFDSGRIINAHDAQEEVKSSEKIAVFDIPHNVSGDFMVAFIVAETKTTPIVLLVEWENNKPLSFWFDRLRILGIKTVALPFDANQVSKETLLSVVQTFKREGFDVIKFKRLMRAEQIENGRWLVNNCRFSYETIPALSELGKFRDFKTKHGLEQDIVAAVMYAGQVLRKSHVKKELAEKLKSNYNGNRNINITGGNCFNGVSL